MAINQGGSGEEEYRVCSSSKVAPFDRFEIKKKLKTAKKKEKEEKKRKQEEEQEKRKLSQVQDTQVVSARMFQHGWWDDDVQPWVRGVGSRSLDGSCFCRQVMSHNKERRSKRDEKLDKKSQAMEELKAEREKKKNKTGGCVFHRLWRASRGSADDPSLWRAAELLAKRQPLKTSEVYSDDEEEEEEDDDKSSVKSDRSSRSSSFDDDE